VSVPLLPGPLSELGRRPFSFFPPIFGIEHNEWNLCRATWTEVQVLNTKTGTELWIPRRFLGDVSSIEAPMMIVGLLKELEYKEGALIPHRRRVIEMPRAVNGSAHAMAAATAPTGHLAPVIAIRTEQDNASRAHKLVRGSVAVGILACVAVGFVVRDVHLGARSVWARTVARPVNLSSEDDFNSVVEKLGRPASDRWLHTPGGAEYRRMWYPRRGIAVILTGADRGSARYAGAVNGNGRIVHAATPALLREISGFEAVR
jgi:hypothetical protein